MGHGAERGNRNGRGPGRMVGVAAEQRTAKARRIFAEASGEGADPSFVGSRRQCQREQKADRLGALGGKVGEIHAQRLAADALRRIVGKEMDAGNDTIGREHQIASRWRGERRGVVDEPQRAGRGSKRPEIARNQAVFG